MSDRTSPSLLDITGLSVSYTVYEGVLRVLNRVSMALHTGEKVGLVGESGCGKTTTILSILGLLPAEGHIINGSIRFKGQDVLKLSEKVCRKYLANSVSVIFQDPTAALNPVFTVGYQLEDAIRSSLHLAGKSPGKRDVRKRAIGALQAAQLPDPERMLSSYPVQLSGGMRQRVCIALALATPSEMILADEPGTSLDVTIHDQILRLLKQLVEENNVAILLISHSLGVVREWTDRVYVMYAGTIVEASKTVGLFETPQHPYTVGLLNAIPRLATRKAFHGIPGRVIEYINPPLGCRFYARCIHHMAICNTEQPSGFDVHDQHFANCFLYRSDITERPDQLVQHQASPSHSLQSDVLTKGTITAKASIRQSSSTLHVNKDAGSESELVSLRDLKKHFKTIKGLVRAVDGISFAIHAEETFGLVGESGSGKSTAAYVMIGMQDPTEGEIYYRGKLVAKAGRKRVRFTGSDMQIVFQDPSSSLNPHKTIKQILEMPLRTNSVPARERNKRVKELLSHVGLPEAFLNKYPRKIGGGEQQLVGVARALAVNPSLVVLDEPTSALDVSMQANIINLLARLQQDLSLAYLFITHDLSLMRNVASRVAIMYLGKIQEVASTEQFFTNPLHPYTKTLLSSIPVVTKEDEQAKPPKSSSRGEIASPINPPSGCRFHPRCHQCASRCGKEEPPLVEVEPEHLVRCYQFCDFK